MKATSLKSSKVGFKGGIDLLIASRHPKTAIRNEIVSIKMSEKFSPIIYESSLSRALMVHKALTERSAERSCFAFRFKHESVCKTLADLAHSLKPNIVFQDGEDTAILEFADKNFVRINKDHKQKNIYSITTYGDFDWSAAIKNKYANAKDKRGKIKWFYSRKGEISSKSFDVVEPLPVQDEYYPMIKDGIEDYLDAYLASRSSILILMGAPGTGKTNLLRHLLWSRSLKASVTFDEMVLADEEHFINFASGDDDGDGDDSDVMIVEDADLLLSARESEQNKVMAKLLNVSEGIIPLDRKKMIFTTNLPNINRIDPAIVRPGRCFGVLHFRALVGDEIKKAATVAGLSLIGDPKELTKELTLAELFNSARTKDDVEKLKMLKTA